MRELLYIFDGGCFYNHSHSCRSSFLTNLQQRLLAKPYFSKKRFSLLGHFPVRLCKMGPLYSDCVSDTKTRFLKNSSQSFACVEAICPQPHRAVRLPYFIEDLSKFSPEPKSILPRNRDKTGFEIIGILLNKEEIEVGGDIDGGNEIGYFCGSPPVRTHNPVIHDAEFTKQMAIPLVSNLPVLSNPSSSRVERGSPICNPGSPKIRVEGFSCGKSDPCCVPTLA
ncbi:uncharacterized protein LOC110096385 [Dendrobium catenatum]|nr:uncharacterized protein LOC110096385 [Dendrobium catenatum]XP_028551134.1 uncharacterized protein LOC110096385 [Dendrobium catenatum]